MVFARIPTATPANAAGPAERDLSRVWAQRLYPAADLRTQDGLTLQVVYPGRPNADRGPDFLDALLVFDAGPLRRGDVELHLRPSDWNAHGHSGDPAYAGVVLHVVADAGPHTRLAGKPLLELHFDRLRMTLPSMAMESERAGGSATCASPQRPYGEPEGDAPPRKFPIASSDPLLLDDMGLARFEAQAAAMEGDIAAVGPQQALYEALLEGLGYTKNMAPFREIARRLPLALLRELVQGAPSAADQEARLAGLLFGTGRLLPSQRQDAVTESRPLPDAYTRLVEEAWAILGGMEPLERGAWRAFRVRPENLPPRRTGAAVALVQRWLNQDFIGRLRCAVQVPDPQEAARSVVNALRIGPEGYWGQHRDFGVLRSNGTTAALLGEGRAREMAASAAIPYLVALGDWAGDRTLETSARAAYAALPAGPQNGLARWASVRFLAAEDERPRMALNAQRQQGLLHLAKTRL